MPSWVASSVENITTPSSRTSMVTAFGDCIDGLSGSVWSVNARGDNRTGPNAYCEVVNTNGDMSVLVAGDNTINPPLPNTGGYSGGGYYGTPGQNLWAGMCPEGKAVADVNFNDPFSASQAYDPGDAASPRWGDVDTADWDGGLIGFSDAPHDDMFIITDEEASATSQCMAIFYRNATIIYPIILGTVIMNGEETEAATSSIFSTIGGGNNGWTTTWQSNTTSFMGHAPGNNDDEKHFCYNPDNPTLFRQTGKMSEFVSDHGSFRGLRSGQWYFYPFCYDEGSLGSGADKHLGYSRQIRVGPWIEHRRFLEDGSSNVLAIATAPSTSTAHAGLYFMNDSLIP